MVSLKKGFFILFLLFTIVACGANMRQILSEPTQTDGLTSLRDSSVSWQYLLKTETGQTPTLSSLKMNDQKPTILLFSKYTCQSCIAEHNQIRQSFENQLNYNQFINIYTFIVDGTFASEAGIQTANEWRLNHQLPWPLGVDPQQRLYRSFCGNKQAVPCVVVFDSNNFKVFSHIGRVSIADLQAISGVNWVTGDPPVEDPDEQSQENQAGDLLGAILETTDATVTADGGQTFSEIDLAQNQSKKTVLLISTIGCIGCISEHTHIMNEALDLVAQHHFYTLLLDVEPSHSESITQWWQELQHPWGLVLGSAPGLFFDLIPETLDKTTPAIFIYDETNRLIYLHVGEITIETLRSYLEN